MSFIQPTSWSEAIDARAAYPDAVVVAGGTDVMVDINFGRLHPGAIIDLGRVSDLRTWSRRNGRICVGAGVTYHDLITGLAVALPGLAAAARTVGSPPIRNRGTIGGNLGSASPAGDCHPPLLACGAEVEVASLRAVRMIPIADFFLGPKRNALAADELIRSVWVPVAAGPQTFTKVGPRNAMVIAVCSFALAFDTRRRPAGTGIGSAGPTPLRARAAEEFLDAALERAGAWDTGAPVDEATVATFGELVVDAARPIDDVRGTAAYRRHALGVIARRSLVSCWEQLRRAAA